MIRELNFTPEPLSVEITPDLSSYLNDIESTDISRRELKARLEAKGGYAKINDYTDDRELRKVSAEQADVILREYDARQEIRRLQVQCDSYLSFYDDIMKGTLSSSRELKARLEAKGGYAKVDSYTEDRELRKVSTEQADVIKTVYEVTISGTASTKSTGDAVSFMRDVSEGVILSRRELKARLEAKGGYAKVDSYTEDRELRKVSTEQADVILEQFDELQVVQGARKSADDYASYLGQIFSRTLNRKQLAARLEAKGGYAKIDRYTEDPEPRKVSAEQAATLLAVFDAFETLDTEIQQDISRTWRLGSGLRGPTALMEERRLAAVTAEDANMLGAKAAQVERIMQIVKQARLEQRVMTAICTTPRDTRNTFEIIRRYGIVDETDRRLAESLTARAYQARRFYFTLDTLANINGSSTTEERTELLKRVTEFGDSPSKSDAQQAGKLTTLIYQAELAAAGVQLVSELSPKNFDAVRYRQIVGALPLRASLPNFDYAKNLESLLAALQPAVVVNRDYIVTQEVATITNRFRSGTARETLQLISELPAETTEDMALQENILRLYKQYLLSRRTKRVQDCEVVFAFEIAALQKVLAPEYEFDQGLGRNFKATRLLASRFGQVIVPLFESLRGEPDGQRLTNFTERGDNSRRNRYVQDLGRLANQRPLSAIEESYLTSTELLSMFNPHLVALANTDPAITSVYLESHFNALSKTTLQNLKDGDHLPLIQIGLGPNGLATAGEIVRSRPDIAADALFIDDAYLPGGPFAVPGGPAWELNSANSNEMQGAVLPPPPNAKDEQKAVRAYGSPLRWYPGERLDGTDIRQGSINSTVDYLLTPDSISDSRYPDNSDEALILQLQAAMLISKVALRTQVLSVKNIGDSSNPYRKQLTLRHTDEAGNARTVSVTTDRLIISSGLGKPSYGFDIARSRAKEILAAEQTNPGFPRLSDTLTAFKALVESKDDDQKAPGEVVLIYGNGNSADTLIEYLGGLFQSGNKTVRGIKKVYVVTNGELSRRPRYAAISDLRARNGRGNLVELIPARVGDISFESPVSQKMVVYDTNGSAIQDERGITIRADNVIAATGFRPQLDQLLAPITGNKSIRAPGVLTAVTLPTNTNVAIADKLNDDPTVLLVGTGSRPGFETIDKLRQLPPSSREALLRNGAENAVAIGFRAPDTQAAVRLFLEEVPSDTGTPKSQLVTKRRVEADTRRTSSTIPVMTSIAPPAIRTDVQADSAVLGPLLLRQLADLQITGLDTEAADDDPTISLNFELSVDDATQELKLSSLSPGGYALDSAVAAACADPYFQTYARKALTSRRNSRCIEIQLELKHGRVSPRNSYVQAA